MPRRRVHLSGDRVRGLPLLKSGKMTIGYYRRSLFFLIFPESLCNFATRVTDAV
jgi:hypothetical protein